MKKSMLEKAKYFLMWKKNNPKPKNQKLEKYRFRKSYRKP